MNLGIGDHVSFVGRINGNGMHSTLADAAVFPVSMSLSAVALEDGKGFL